MPVRGASVRVVLVCWQRGARLRRWWQEDEEVVVEEVMVALRVVVVAVRSEELKVVVARGRRGWRLSVVGG